MELAESLGATHIINTSDAGLDLVQEIRNMTRGAGTSVTVDTTGNVDIITKGLEMTAKGGQMILIGLMPLDAELKVHLFSHLSVRDANNSPMINADMVHFTRWRNRYGVALREVLHTARYFRLLFSEGPTTTSDSGLVRPANDRMVSGVEVPY